MPLLILRAVFVACVLAVVLVAMSQKESEAIWGSSVWATVGAVGIAMIIVAIDMLTPRKSLAAISGVFFGLLVGMLVTLIAWVMIDLLVVISPGSTVPRWLEPTKFVLGAVCCYLAVSFILQTKDDIRFIIPYVEFAKQTKGARPLVLDTSVIIDGRIADICDTRIIDSPLVIPRMVLQELQGIADSSDKLRRNRGRRGLDMLNKLQTNTKIDLQILDAQPSAKDDPREAVDQRLVTLTKELHGRIVTNDYNLNKIAQLRGVDVININDLANALKPVVLPGEHMSVKIIKPGEEPGQGVGYLEDGTMVVAEAARDKIGEEVSITITSVLQTSAGRMIFGRSEGAPPVERRRRSKAVT